MSERSVALIATGSEILHGFVPDANNSWISRRLFQAGYEVRLHLAVDDDPERIAGAVLQARTAAAIVIMSGGLGPTDDDLTVEVVRRMFARPVTVHAESLARMRGFFAASGRVILPRDMRMVTVPEGAEIFLNPAGLAPGFALDTAQGPLIALPGPPEEMRAILESGVMPYLQKRFPGPAPRNVLLRTVLMRESEVNELLAVMDTVRERLDWGVTTAAGMNEILLTARPDGPFDAEAIRQEAREKFGDALLLPESPNLETEVLTLLRRRGLRLATAESCTGGLVAKLLTDVPGSSAAFLGGVVTYSNSSKSALLGVDPATLERHGAVSPETAAEMALGARVRFQADIGIATTGIAGPDGGSPAKPVGTVCFGFAHAGGVDSWREQFAPDRCRVRNYAALRILNRVRLHAMREP